MKDMHIRFLKYAGVAGLAVASACGEGSGPAREALTVVRSGTGTGTVTSVPAGIACGTTCSAQFDRGASVTLTATPDASSQFVGWQAEGCGAAATCVVDMASSLTVTAQFARRPELTLSRAGDGTGTVTSTPAGIDCGVTCNARFDDGTTVTLTASAPAGSVFAGWAGEGCSGTDACVLSMTAERAVTASFDPVIGPPASIVVLSGSGQSALAATQLPTAIQIAVRDEYGHGVPGVTVTFAVAAGDGSLAATTATTAGNGTATVPAWTLGRSAEPQTVRATVDAITADIAATVATQYSIALRISATPEQAVLFQRAAARISAIVVGDLLDADARAGVDMTACGFPGETVNEIIDDVLIFGAIKFIDGPGGVLASAGPCFTRNTDNGQMTAIGVMTFDSSDLETLAGGGDLQDVIMHEMLHVLGIGTLWSNRSLIVGGAYGGAGAARECRAIGGDAVCASGVPIEDQGGAGTRNSHWREATFVNELMTGFLNAGGNPLSRITIGGLQDIGFEVNFAPFDAYMVPGAAALRADSGVPLPAGWERTVRPVGVLENGRVKPFPEP